MARNIRVTDVNLFHAMKTTMMRSLRQSTLMKMYALERDVPVRFHGHGLNEPVNYCMVCEEEVSLVFLVPVPIQMRILKLERTKTLKNLKHILPCGVNDTAKIFCTRESETICENT